MNGLFFILWDGWFVRTNVWSFNPQYVWHFRWNDLPIEEWSFFFVIPYASVFIYACLKAYLKPNFLNSYKHHITLFFLLLTFVLALFNSQKIYTFYNCLFAFVLLLIHYYLKKDWMGYFWMAYFIHLIPFLIINGVLTSKPVVLYNPEEILGLKIYTIPVEDTIYALTCLLFPITITEWLMSKKSKLA
jgi:lycopene cyclase domain-containing protein